MPTPPAHGDDPDAAEHAAPGRRRLTPPSRVLTFDGLVEGREHFAFTLGLGNRAGTPISAERSALPVVRLHSECLTGDVFDSQRCDCGAQLCETVERIADAGEFLLYLRQEGRGIGLSKDRRLRAAGRRPRHVRGQPGTRIRGGQASSLPRCRLLWAWSSCSC